MDKKNRIYYVVEQPIPLTYQIVKAINKIPSVKCSFRTRRPYLIVGVAPNRENELVEVVKDMGGFDFSREIETLEKTFCVMSLKFFVAMQEYFKDREDVELIPIYIDVSARERLSRSMIREEKEENPNYKEIIRRFIADEDDFREEVLATIPACNKFVNDDFEQFVNEVVEMIRNKIGSTESTLTKNDLKKLLLVVNNGGKQAALAKGEIIKAFRKNDAYEEFLFDVFSYCEEGMLLEQFPTTSEFSFDDMLEHLFSDMQGTLD